EIAPGVDARDLGRLPFQGVRAAAPRGQRDLAFRRQAAHQDSDMEGVQGRTHDHIRRLARPYALNTVNRLETIRGRGRKFARTSPSPSWGGWSQRSGGRVGRAGRYGTRRWNSPVAPTRLRPDGLSHPPHEGEGEAARCPSPAGRGLLPPDPFDFPVQLYACLFQHVGADGFTQ